MEKADLGVSELLSRILCNYEIWKTSISEDIATSF